MPAIKKECIKPLLETKFIKVFDLQYAEGKHYYDATRNSLDNLAAVRTDDEFRKMLPDAVTCIVILCPEGEEAKLLLSYEYRYPVGRFLLSPPAGLLDPEDRESSSPLIHAAEREIKEETGLEITESDRKIIVSPLAFSTPGMTDESNGLVCIVKKSDKDGKFHLTQEGAIGSECFDGMELLDRKTALELLKNGRDKYGNYFSVYTWAALSYFVSDAWNGDERKI